jgi:chromosome partitioning protein
MDLAAAEIDLLGVENREHQLRRILEPLSPSFDYILIDSPPSLNILSVNALSAARWVLIPVQAEFMALEGLAHVINIVQRIHAGFNPSLELLGLAVTLYDRRTRLAAEVVRELETIFDGKVFASRITRSVRLSEAPSHGKPIIYYDPKSPGARAYQELSEEIQHACEKTGLGPGA